ncbi:MAG: hypothetical protein ABXS92_08685 [Sulfurimonas sp.]
MKSRETVLEALKEGKNLISSVTGLEYTLINDILHTRHSDNKEWKQSDLTFHNPPSWLNLTTIEIEEKATHS